MLTNDRFRYSTAQMLLHAPFPWFGGKSRVASEVWRHFGDVPNYVEPFAGSLAVLLGRPHSAQTETVNDKDALLANFWRALKAEPEKVAEYANWPVNEADLHARHIWLVRQKDGLNDHVSADPEYYDAKIAGWWVWGINCWIGSGWCSGDGPWTEMDGRLVHLGNQGRSVHRNLVHLGNQGVHRKRVHLGDGGQGVHRQRVHLGPGGTAGGQGVHKVRQGALFHWMRELADRLRRVRVCCGEWDRVLGPSVTFKHGLTGVFLDPPYSQETRSSGLYREDDLNVARKVWEWALANGDNPLLRIALCGYEGEHELPGWTIHRWKAHGAYGAAQSDSRGRANAPRERIWFSPYCLKGEQLVLL